MGAREELGLPGVTAELPSQSQQAVHEAETAGSKGGKSQARPGSENKEGESKEESTQKPEAFAVGLQIEPVMRGIGSREPVLPSK